MPENDAELHGEKPEGFLKENSEVLIYPDYVEKRMRVPELAAYDLLYCNAARLAESHPAIIVPKVLEHSVTGMHRISKLPNFEGLSVAELFGRSVTNQDVPAILSAIETIQTLNINGNSLPDYEDSSVDHAGYLFRYSEALPNALHEYTAVTKKLLGREIALAQGLPEVIVHGDENPGNMRRIGDNTVGVIDWENLALARVGYGQAKFAHHLPLSPDVQEKVIQGYLETTNTSEERDYFHAVLGTRSYLTLARMQTGFYDSGIGDDLSLKEKIENGLVRTIELCATKLNI